MNEEKQTNETLAVAPAQTHTQALSIWDAGGRFEHYQRVAKALASSSLVPQQFQNNIPNTLIALDMAERLKANPLAVMQSLYVVHGKPAWSASFLIAMTNSCGRFSPMQFKLTGTGDSQTCVASAKIKSTGEVLEGPPVSIATAKAEGWVGRNGSKWRTMPELMLRYRAATWWARLYAPELTMGMQTTEEVVDIEGAEVQKHGGDWKTPKRPQLFGGSPQAASTPADTEAGAGVGLTKNEQHETADVTETEYSGPRGPADTAPADPPKRRRGRPKKEESVPMPAEEETAPEPEPEPPDDIPMGEATETNTTDEYIQREDGSWCRNANYQKP